MELDHVLIAVADLAEAGRELEASHGLTSLEGGRHPGWGTANRIVPLGEAYLELVAVVDGDQAARSSFGRWVAGGQGRGFRPLGWAVRTDQLDAVAQRLGLEVGAGARRGRGGRPVRWRMAGIEQAAGEPSLPFFIQWEPGTPPPGRTRATHQAGPVWIARLELDGDADRLAAWLGSHRLPITIRGGRPSVARVVLAGPSGEIVLAADRS